MRPLVAAGGRSGSQPFALAFFWRQHSLLPMFPLYCYACLCSCKGVTTTRSQCPLFQLIKEAKTKASDAASVPQIYAGLAKLRAKKYHPNHTMLLQK